MLQQREDSTRQVGLFVNPVARRRVDFQATCGQQFGRLFVAEDAAAAVRILARQQVDLPVITVSLAVAQAVGEESADALMLRVNAALARVKRAGRNCVELAMQ